MLWLLQSTMIVAYIAAIFGYGRSPAKTRMRRRAVWWLRERSRKEWQ